METKLTCENCGKASEWDELRWYVENFPRDFEDVPFHIYERSTAGIDGKCPDCGDLVF